MIQDGDRRSRNQAVGESGTGFRVLFVAALLCLLLASLLAGCSALGGPKYPTLIPTEYVPTALALTVEAGRPAGPTAAESPASPSESVDSANTAPAGTPAASATSARSPSARLKETALPASPAGAASPTGAGSPTGAASPRSATPTAGATKAAAPAGTASLTPAAENTTPTPALTPTDTATIRYRRTPTLTQTPGIPNATILIYSPGPMSKEISPIEFSASLQPGPSGKVLIQLVGEGGRNLYTKLLRFNTQDWVLISEEVDFSIAAAAESARLQISTDDDHGRTIALASVDLLLLSVGEDDLNPPSDLLEPLIIREPTVNTLIQGGKLVVTGLILTSGVQPPLVQLVDENGAVVGYRQAVVTLPVDPWATQGYATFTAEVPYEVNGPTWVRLEVSAFEDTIPGPTHLSSLVILLGP